jgi:D-alanyl-D-alanine carboxypeptidase
VFVVVLFAILIALLFYLFKVILNDDPAGGGSSGPLFGWGGGSSADEGQGGSSGGAPSEGIELQDPGYPSYYDPALEARYEAFAAARGDLTEDEVYWMVGCDLDKDPYTDTQPVPDPESYLMLVNKHYYLPEDFYPSDMVTVGATQMREEAAGNLNDMIDAAAVEGLKLWAQSGFRSYGLQVDLYNKYAASDGSEAADTYSARAGYSEHQTGLTVDLNTITDAFGDTAEGQWVKEHAHEYGFIIRYTEENTDVTLYKYEPWHIRYIGIEAATRMHDEGIASFEEYWVKYVK